jgi:dual specificity phosphatase 12
LLYSYTVVTSDYFVEHEQGAGQPAFAYRKRDTNAIRDSRNVCTAYFIEAMEWITSRTQEELDGKITCPKCAAKLGNYNWAGECISGEKRVK